MEAEERDRHILRCSRYCRTASPIDQLLCTRRKVYGAGDVDDGERVRSG